MIGYKMLSAYIFALIWMVFTSCNLAYGDVINRFVGEGIFPDEVFSNATETPFLSSVGIPLSVDVTGMVTDQEGEPLIGVNIQIKGTGTGTATDVDGRFVLEDVDENAVLIVSYIGYETQEVTLSGRSELHIVLLSDSQLLEEVVVTAL